MRLVLFGPAAISVACTLFSGSLGEHKHVRTHIYASSLAEIAQLVEQRHGGSQTLPTIFARKSRIPNNGQ